MNIQLKEAIALRKAWSGGFCDHAELAKEYDLGGSTGDYVCLRCGESGWGSDWPEKSQKTKEANK